MTLLIVMLKPISFYTQKQRLSRLLNLNTLTSLEEKIHLKKNVEDLHHFLMRIILMLPMRKHPR